MDLFTILRQNPYPGRGIVLGCTDDGNSSILCYFIMGRSVNSRNRVIVRENGEFIIRAHDASKMTDPSLIIYTPVRKWGDCHIVSNGDQTDTIYDCISGGGTFQDALRLRSFEPDAPNYTPRISGFIYQDGRYALSILKSFNGNPNICCRYFFEYPRIPGTAHFISTYAGDGDPLPSFAGEPVAVPLSGGFEDFAEGLWKSLNPDNKVSLIVNRIPADGSECEPLVYNKLN